MSDDKYESHIKNDIRMSDADTDEVKSYTLSNTKRNSTFLLKMRYAPLLGGFQADQAPKPSAASSQQPRQTKKVASLSELGADKDMEIEELK